jgi:hypothetical protein
MAAIDPGRSPRYGQEPLAANDAQTLGSKRKKDEAPEAPDQS